MAEVAEVAEIVLQLEALAGMGMGLRFFVFIFKERTMSKRFAIINYDNIVENIAIADDAFNSTWFDITSIDPQPGIGWIYNEGVFVPPFEPSRVSLLPNIITKVAMLTGRLTQAEFVSILTAAKMDPAVEAWKYVFDSSTQVDLDSKNTKDGIALLVSKSLLTQERADKILTDPVQPEERP